jgi:hypothetical protein
MARSHWQPIPELAYPNGTRLTIFFVNKLHTYFRHESADAIFPAYNQTFAPDDPNPFYVHKDPRARAVICVDETLHCTPDGATCWNFAQEEGNFPDETSPEYYLMSYALLFSTMFDSLALRLGDALLAGQSISQYVSKALERDQWKLEMENLFNTSLARIQFDAWSISSGEGSDRDDTDRMLPEEGSSLSVCGPFKFKTAGYVNVLWKWSILFLLEPIASWVLSWDVKGKKSKRRGSPKPQPIGVQAEPSTLSPLPEPSSSREPPVLWGPGMSSIPPDSLPDAEQVSDSDAGDLGDALKVGPSAVQESRAPPSSRPETGHGTQPQATGPGGDGDADEGAYEEEEEDDERLIVLTWILKRSFYTWPALLIAKTKDGYERWRDRHSSASV